MSASDGEIPPVKAHPVNVLAIIAAPYIIGVAVVVAAIWRPW